MRILNIISSLASGGAEVYVRDLSAQMVREGHEVCVIYISSAKQLGRSLEFETDFKEDLLKSGIAFYELGYECRRNLLLGGLRLRKLIKSVKPDLVHSHLYYGIFFSIFANRSVPLVYTHHNHRLGKGRFFYPFFNRFVARYIGISNDCTCTLSTAVSDNKITTIYNGVNVDRLVVKEKYNSSETDIKALCVGSLVKQKNYNLLIHACGDLIIRRPDIRGRFFVRIAGEGGLRSGLVELVNQLGLSEMIDFLGNRQDVPQLLNDSDIFVMSSDWEGLPISLLEALTTGLPSVVTDVGGCRDVVEACSAGIVVPPGNKGALSVALESLIDSGTLRAELSEHAKSAGKRYSIGSAASAHLSLYKSILTGEKK